MDDTTPTRCERKFRDWYVQLAKSDRATEKRVAIGMLELLCDETFVNYADWADRAPKLESFTMNGSRYDALDTKLLVDIKQIEYLVPYDKLEIFLLRFVGPSVPRGRLAYRRTYRGRQSSDWLDLERTPVNTLNNLFGHILVACPKPYVAEHDALRRKAQKDVAEGKA